MLLWWWPGEVLPFASCLFCLYSDSGSQALKLTGEKELMSNTRGWFGTGHQGDSHVS